MVLLIWGWTQVSLRFWVLVVGIVSVLVIMRELMIVIVRVRFAAAVGVPYLLVLLSDELLRLAVGAAGHHGNGEVCAALPRQLTAERCRGCRDTSIVGIKCWYHHASTCCSLSPRARRGL